MTCAVLIAGGGTGGHVFPALAVADALGALANVEIVFGGSPRGIENEVIPRRGYRLETLDIAPMKGGGLRRAFFGACTAGVATVVAVRVVKHISPRVTLSVGGYAAGPFALASVILGIPVAILEPNGVLGFTNRLLAPVCKRAYVAWPDLATQIGRDVTRVLGVPLRAGFDAKPYHATGRARVLVLGGSQGAEALNERVPRALARAQASLGRVSVVHQTGKNRDSAVRGVYHDAGLPDALAVPFLEDVSEQIAAADLVIARAGAGTVAEIAAIGRASILVPFPFAADDHQTKNARALAREGGCVVVGQGEATVERLTSEVVSLLGDSVRRTALADRARRVGRPNAAKDIALDLVALAQLPLSRERGPQDGLGVSPQPGVV